MTGRPQPVRRLDSIHGSEPGAAVDCVLDACPVLRAVVDRIRSTGLADHGSLVALRHSLGHLPGGPARFNALVRRLPGVRPDQLLHARLGGHPVSCSKLLRRVSDEDRWQCASCVFSQAGAAYPSPVLHAQGKPDPRRSEQIGAERG